MGHGLQTFFSARSKLPRPLGSHPTDQPRVLKPLRPESGGARNGRVGVLATPAFVFLRRLGPILAVHQSTASLEI